jgi:DNA-binding transcriptional MerR regulator
LIKSYFSIKDLENLSGIKAHTIRIWEKRYDLLSPIRSKSNIRSYTLQSLQKILNVSYLKENDYKISAIASMSDSEIESTVRRLAESDNNGNHSLQELKLAMINFDKNLFHSVYSKGFKEVGFKGVFHTIIIPFLNELGYLWLSNTVNIAHEHFISHLIKQKLLSQLESLEYEENKEHEDLYILFLPENEMHDLGLLYLNYELLSRGRKTIYLGASMLVDTLSFFQNKGIQPIYITYITVSPNIKAMPRFLKDFQRKVSPNNENKLWILGHVVNKMQDFELRDNHKTFNSIDHLIEQL